MSKLSSSYTFGVLLLLALAFLLASPASPTAHKEIKVPLECPFEPVSAVGLIISGRETRQKPEARFEKSGDNCTVIFSASRSETKGPLVISAMLLSADGQMSLAEMRPIRDPETMPDLSAMKLCPEPEPKAVNFEDQGALLETLLDVRSRRRNVLQATLKDTLKGDFLERLRKLERGFGLTRARELGPDLEPYELLDRLSRLKLAVNNLDQAPAGASLPQAAQTQPATTGTPAAGKPL